MVRDCKSFNDPIHSNISINIGLLIFTFSQYGLLP